MADWYDALASERGTEFHQQVIVPGLLRLLDLRRGEKVCDLACGQGAVTQALAAKGALLTGVDLSPRLIELAKRRAQEAGPRRPGRAVRGTPRGARTQSQGIRYIVSDARNVGALESGSFDAVTCVLAAMNMDPVEPLFAEMARLLGPASPLPSRERVRVRGDSLRPEGEGEGDPPPRRAEVPWALRRSLIGAAATACAVIVVLHPAFRVPRQSRWKWDEGRKLLTREIDRYLGPLAVPIDMQPFNRPGEASTTTYHRPVSAYVNGLARAGLLVDALEEWPSHRVSQPGARAKAENRARDEFPLFLAIRAVKVPALAPAAGPRPERVDV